MVSGRAHRGDHGTGVGGRRTGLRSLPLHPRHSRKRRTEHRSQSGTNPRDHCGPVQQVPAPTTAGERLRTFSLGHLSQVAGANRNLVRETLDRVGGSGPLIVDIDSSIFEVHGYLKEGARYGYSKVRGLHPLLAFLNGERLLLGARLRMDAGFYARDIESFCGKRGLRFSISAKLTGRLVKAILALPETAWQVYPWEEGAEWAELRYQPQNWSRPYRLLVKRTPWYEKEQRVLGEYFHTAVITNLVGAGCSLIRYHLGRGGMENYIEVQERDRGATSSLAALPGQLGLAAHRRPGLQPGSGIQAPAPAHNPPPRSDQEASPALVQRGRPLDPDRAPLDPESGPRAGDGAHIRAGSEAPRRHLTSTRSKRTQA